MKKNGFTLIELLAAFVVLSVIAMIAVPMVTKDLEESRYKSFQTSVQSFVNELRSENAMVDYEGIYYTFPLPEDSDLGMKGDMSNWVGESFIDENGKIGINISQGKYCAYKSVEDELVDFDKNCSGWEHRSNIKIYVISDRYDDSTGIYSQLYGENYVEPKIEAYDGYGKTLPYTVRYSETVVTNVYPKSYTMTITATDERGNTFEKEVTIEIVDHIPPVITVDGHTSDYSITLEAQNSYTIPSASVTDNSEEVIEASVSGMVTPTIEGTYKIIYTAKDSSNNIATLILTIQVQDTKGPEITILGNPTAWTNKSIVLAVNAVDTGSGLPVKAYSYDGGNTWQSGNCVIVDENKTLNIWVRDNKGNITKKVVIVDKIDKTIPDVTFEVTSGTSGLNYWYKSNVGVKVTPIAGESGVASYQYCTTTGTSCTPSTTVSGGSPTTVTLSTESDSNKICVFVRSVSGQTNTKCSGNYKIDKSAPIITVDGHTSDYSVSFGTRPSYTIPSGTATDNYTTNVSVSRSGSVTPTIVGTYKITYTAKDDAGNTKTLVLSVNVLTPTYSAWMTESELNAAGHTTTEYGIDSKPQYRSKTFDKYTTSSGPIDETSVLAKIYYQDINYIVYENGAWLAQTSSPTYVGTVDGLATYRWNRWGFRTAGVGGYKGSASYHNTQFSVNYVRTDKCWSNCGGNGTVTSTTAAFNPQVTAADTGATFSSTLIGIASMGYTDQDYTDYHGYRVSINELGELVEYNADRDGNYGKTSWKYDNNVGNKTYTEGVELSGYSGNVTLSMTTRKIQRKGSSNNPVSGEEAYADITGLYLRERTYKIDKTNTVTTNIVGTYYITTVFGSWGAWQDAAIAETADVKVETRTVYRYQTN